MAQQKSDRRVVPQGGRKAASTGVLEKRRGGKATTVTQETRQLGLKFGTAENSGSVMPEVVVAAATRPRVAAAHATPKPNGKKEIARVSDDGRSNAPLASAHLHQDPIGKASKMCASNLTM